MVSAKVCNLKNEMDEIDNKLLNIFELSIINKKKDNVIKSLSGNVEYLREKQKND